MNENRMCPAPEEILAWLDGELEGNLIAEHIEECLHCQTMVDTVQTENALLSEMFKEIPDIPDISKKVMAQIEDISLRLNHLSSLLYVLLMASLSFSLVLFHNYLTHLINMDFWPVAIVKIGSFTAGLINSGYETINYILTKVLPGESLLPALIITVLVTLINIFIKRRLPNV